MKLSLNLFVHFVHSAHSVHCVHSVVLIAVITLMLIPTIAIAQEVLLIPDSSSRMVGKYNPTNGAYLGDLIDGTALFTTPINAVQGPDGNIYVSDQVKNSVFLFDTSGAYISTFIDSSAGLNNIRGIDFRGTHLFVTSGDDYVAEFDDKGKRLADFINDDADPFDIHFLPDGRSLLSNIGGSADNVRLYNFDGTFNRQIFAVVFPEQIQRDSDTDYLNASFTAGVITEFNLSATVSSISFSNGRGIYRLGNGNYLATSINSVLELNPTTGAVITTIRTGLSPRYIELATLSFITPTPSSTFPTYTPTKLLTHTPTPEKPTATPPVTRTPLFTPTATLTSTMMDIPATGTAGNYFLVIVVCVCLSIILIKIKTL